MSRLLKSCIANQLNFFSKPQTWKKKQNFFLFLLVPAAWLAKQMVQEIRLVLPFFFPPQHTK